jgi:hypothetical protein
MKDFLSLVVTLFLLFTTVQAWAAPTPPVLSHLTRGTNLIVYWTDVPDADGYILYYAPYPYTGPETIESMSMGEENHFSIYLWNGAAYYIAVTAINASGESEFSNIDSFIIKEPAIPESLTITGDAQAYEDDTLQLTATATWSDGTTTDVTTSAIWSENSSAVSSVSNGLLATSQVSSDAQATINASFSYEGVTLNDTYLITVKDTPPLTNNGNGTVTDNITGLVWQQTDDDVSRSWQIAMNYCEDLTLGRFSDWRLPNKEELTSLVEPRQYPTINNSYFLGTNASNYWSSTSIVYLHKYALNVDFNNGSVYNYYKTNYYYVRCVR